MELGKIISYKKGKAPTGVKLNDEIVIYLSPEYLRSKSKEILIPDFLGKVEVKKGDLLLLWDGSNAGEFFLGKDGVLSSTMVKLLFDEKENDRLFLYYQLKFIEDFLKSQTNGSGIPHVDKEILLSIDVEKFNPTEQTTIARILSKVDEAIAQTEQLIAKYSRIKTGLMQDLLTKGIDEHGNIRSEQTHEFKDTPLGRIPKEWDFKRLDDCKTKNTSITYGIVQTFDHIEDGVPVLRTIDLKENGINPINQLLRTKQSISAKYKRTLLLENDIVCNVRASVGDFNLVSSEYINCNTTRGVARICPSNEINPSYLVWFLKSYKNEKQMELLIKGTTFIDINIGDLRKIWVLLPKKTEQDAIADKLDKIQNSFKIYDTQLSKLQSLKTGLMQDLLSGKVRVNHLIQETASV